MSENRTEKELAFLHDLYIAPNWGERFAELIDEHVALPKKGRALYVAAGTGGHALALQERGGANLTIICVDESAERLELARAKTAAAKLNRHIEFRATQLEALDFEDDQFDLVLGDASLVAPERLPEMLAEMIRVAAPRGQVALTLVTASSFGEFFSIYWEALSNAGMSEEAEVVEQLINELPTASYMETLAAREGLDEVHAWTRIEEFDYATGTEFLESPLIKNILLKRWLETISGETAQARVLAEIAQIIDAERHDAEFALSIKATLVAGQKAE